MNRFLLTPVDLAEMLGLAPQTVYNRLSTGGDLPPIVRMGRLPRFPVADVQAWVDAKRTPVTGPRRRCGRPTKAEQISRRSRDDR